MEKCRDGEMQGAGCSAALLLHSLTAPQVQHQEGPAAPAQQLGQLNINGAASEPGTFLPCITDTLKTTAWGQGLWQPRGAATTPEALLELFLHSHRSKGSHPHPAHPGQPPRRWGTRWDRCLQDKGTRWNRCLQDGCSQEDMTASCVCTPPHRAGSQEGDFHFHLSKPARSALRHQGKQLKPPH